MSKKGATPKKKKRLKSLITILLALFSVFAFSVFLVFAGLTAIFNNNDSDGSSIVAEIVEAVLTPTRTTTNVLILGTDEGGRGDVRIVASFNSETGRVDIISVPRDTHVIMPEDRRNELILAGRQIPVVMKFGELPAYAGLLRSMEYTKLQAEDLLGLEIHYYARVNLEAFRFIVDQIGGVEFYVPQRMNYRDPVQNLVIDLQPGLQILDGSQAEGLVRYRGYVEADIQRIRVQHDFMMAMVSQIMNRENIINNAFAIITATFNYVDTNFNIINVPQYIRYANMIDLENIHFHVMPGIPEFISGISYIIADEEAIQDLLNSIMINK